jgi:hypothetical protein
LLLLVAIAAESVAGWQCNPLVRRPIGGLSADYDPLLRFSHPLPRCQ